MSTSKSIKKYSGRNTPNTKIGHGDFYGSGVKNPVGKVRDLKLSNVKQPKNYPKSLG